jgi:hypothetical protein
MTVVRRGGTSGITCDRSAWPKMLSLKPDVQLAGIKPEILLAVMVAHSVYESYGMPLMITSVRDGKHMGHSLHYAGLAVDLRTAGIVDAFLQEIVRKIRERLGPEFDVVLEADHVHIEWDVKAKTVKAVA